MKEKTKKITTVSVLFLFAFLIFILAIATAIKGQIHLTSKGANSGVNVSLTEDGAWFYVIPGIQAFIGVVFVFLGIMRIKD